MNIWEILGIGYTNDIEAIRQAYMDRSKQVHPEEHPEEFMDLQRAYKEAVHIAKQKSVSYEYEPDIADAGKEYAEDEDINYTGYSGEAYKEYMDRYYADIASQGDEYTTYEEYTDETSDELYDFSSVRLGDDTNRKLAEEFLWRFKQIYDFEYLRNKIQAWKYFMEGYQSGELFEQGDFIWQFACLFSGLRDLNQNIWDYFVEWIENHQSSGLAEDALLYIKQCREKYARHYISDETHFTQKDRIEVVIREEMRNGISMHNAYKMENFIPYYLLIRKREEQKQIARMEEIKRNPVEYRKKGKRQNTLQLFIVIIILVFFAIVIYCNIKNDRTKEQRMQERSIQESIRIEQIKESLQQEMQQRTNDVPWQR